MSTTIDSDSSLHNAIASTIELREVHINRNWFYNVFGMVSIKGNCSSQQCQMRVCSSPVLRRPQKVSKCVNGTLNTIETGVRSKPAPNKAL